MTWMGSEVEAVVLTDELAPVAIPLAQTQNNDYFLMGWCITETSGSTKAEVDIYDGTDTNGQLVAPIGLPAGTCNVQRFPGKGIWLRNGLFSTVASGTVKGALYVVACPDGYQGG